MKTVNTRTFMAMVTVVALSPALFAQATDGNLVGTVSDPSKSSIPDATIEIVNLDTNVAATAKTDALGQYRFNNLLVGRYKLSASKTGFQTSAIQNIQVQLNRTSTANVVLEVGSVATTVAVTESAALIDTTTAQVQTTFDARQAQMLPLTGISTQGVINLSLLGAGVSSQGGIGYGVGPSVGGQRPTNNNFMIDGIDNNLRSVTGPAVRLTNEAVAEFSLLQNQFSAEFGHSTGGQFNTIVKSGSNSFHGVLYEYLQNRNLNAIDEQFKRAGFRTQAPRLDDNRFGGNIGGPIRRDKLFFFFNYEYNPHGEASTAKGAIFVPTADGIRLLDGIQGLSKTNLDEFKKYVPTASSALAGRFATVRNVQIPLGQLQVSGPAYQNIPQYIASGDYNITEKDQLRIRYTHRRLTQTDTTADLPSFFTNSFDNQHLASISYFKTLRPTLLNELRTAFSRRTTASPIDAYSYPGLDQYPNITLRDLGINVGPNPNLPQDDTGSTYQVIDNLTWITGAHTIKMGYDGRKLNRSAFFIQRARGDYDYQTFERFLLDIVPEFAVRSVGAFPFAGNLLSHYAFLNDDFRLRPNLTVNLGLRYEFVGVPAGARLQRLNSIASIPELPFNEPRATKKDFAPRIGLAWSPGTDGKLSIRAGFGLGYDQVYQNLGINSLPPQFFTTVDAHISRANQPNFLGSGGIPNIAVPVNTPAAARNATASWIPDQIRPYSLQWSLGVQRVFRQDYTLEVRYLASRGVHLPLQIQPNRAAGANNRTGSLLPTFLQRPSQAEIDALRTSLADALQFNSNTLAAQGFGATITAFTPQGNSTYHGLAVQLNRRFSRGLQMLNSYTWSHNIDDSTAALNSTTLTPRRPQDFFDLRPERASSALDHRHRFTMAWVYDAPWFKNANWTKRNLLGNWTFTGIYTAESGTWSTVRSGVDSNLNGDNAADRTIVNPAGAPNTASGVRALCRGGGNCDPNVAADRARIVAWVADNPSARYIVAGQGTLPNGGRNTLLLPGLNNFDITLGKRFNITEGHAIEFRAEAYNVFNHAQYVPGYPNAVALRTRRDAAAGNLTQAGFQRASNAPQSAVNNPVFMRPDLAFQSNSRTMQLVLRYTF